MPTGEERRGTPMVSAQVLRELVGIAGGGLAGYGAWLHYQPAGYMVGGGLLVILAVVGTLRGNS